MQRCTMPYIGLAVVATTLNTGCTQSNADLESEARLKSMIRQQWAASVDHPVDRPRSATAAAESTSRKVDTGDVDPIAADSSLRECLRYAALHSPQLESAWYAWQAELDRIAQVTALPEPRVSYGYYINEVETRVGPQQHRFGASQTLPWFGRLDHIGDAATERAAAARHQFDAAKLALFESVQKSYVDLAYLRQTISYTRQTFELLQQIEEVARRRYEVGTGSHPDLLRLQVELGNVEDRLEQLQQQRRPLAAQFNALLNRDATAPAPWPDALPQVAQTLNRDALERQLRERSPQLQALVAEQRQHRAMAYAARTRAYPDITFSLDYIVTGEAQNPSIAESGDDAIIAGVGVTLPIWNAKYEAGIRESMRRRLRAASEHQSAMNRLSAELQHAIYNYEDGRRRTDLYSRTLVPKARESLNATLAGYQGGTLSFLDVLEAERTLLEFQLAEQRARADAANALASIATLTGGVPPLLEPEAGEVSP